MTDAAKAQAIADVFRWFAEQMAKKKPKRKSK